MDEERFESLTRSLTTTGSRRRALIAALGGALSLDLGASSLQEAAAKKKSCPACKKRQKGKCKPKPNGSSCAGGSCRGGRCITSPLTVSAAFSISACWTVS